MIRGGDVYEKVYGSSNEIKKDSDTVKSGDEDKNGGSGSGVIFMKGSNFQSGQKY